MSLNEPMQNTSAGALEFDSLKEILDRFVVSALGRRELDKVEPVTNRALIEEWHAEAGEAMSYLRLAANPQTTSQGAAIRVRFDSPSTIERTANKLRIEGASLDGQELYDLSAFLDRAADARSCLTATAEKFHRLGRKAAAIGDFRTLLRDFAGKILPGGALADDASVALGRIRRDVDRQQKLIQETLERFLRKHRDDGTVQEDFVTIRNDRFVVPIIAGQQRRVEGVIHGASSSGHTLFLEPIATLEMNNELVRLRDEEAAEVERILREWTARLRERAPEIRAAVESMAALELIFAKANFGREFNCVIPKFAPDSHRRIALHDARHPLLEDILRRQKKLIQPISVTLDEQEQQRTLLISGPNTGGKTVALKTVGMLCLMAHAGIPVPCAEAEFPIVEQVLADIGDHQSLEESLSSFSSHVVEVKFMLEAAHRDSIILLDELGRATDPDEGGALGVAILDRLRKTGAFVLASTHLLPLKMYGANTPGVLNASMGFDEETLQPTYVLRTGAPGKSAGLEIARRLGMPADLIDQARSVMSSGERDVAEFLTQLHARLESVTRLEAQLKDERERLASREETLERDYTKKRDAKLRELEDKSRQLAEQFERNAQQTIDQITQSIDHRKAVEQAQRKVSKARREFLEVVADEIQVEKPGPVKPKPKIEEGVRVRIRGVRDPARVRRLLSDGQLEVEAGILKMRISMDDVEEVLADAGPPPKSKLPTGVSFQQGPTWDVKFSELNVVGRHAEDAMEEVDKFLDRAALAQVHRVRIVHGFGHGILRKAIADLLGKNPHVEKFYPAGSHEGGGGATVVELKD